MLPKTTEKFNEAIIMLFSSNPEAWIEFENGLKSLAMHYAKSAVGTTSNHDLQQQNLGKFDNCITLSEYREKLWEAK